MKTHDDGNCPYCGHKIVKYSHNLNKTLVSALRAIERVGSGKPSKMNLSHVQIANFGKLKYWGFVDKTDRAGHWRITDVGREFLQGNVQVYRTVWTYNDHVDRFDGDLVRVNNIEYETVSRKKFAETRFPFPQIKEKEGRLF